ncbi:hypothetical protein F5B20DRAFT_591095 [Whalleya microplaca]|nr:hypothetical protein F5B20DRAFT_591095 [Whalleya microplaca]
MDFTINSSLLQTPISLATRAEISKELWGSDYCHRLRGVDMNQAAFWTYYSKKCTQALHNGGRHVTARTHRDIVDSLRSKLTTPHDNEDELLENSIDLAASLLLMCDCGSWSHGFSGGIEIQWKRESLREFLTEYFGEPPVLDHDRIKLDKTFTARNFDRIAGIEIVWTDNMLDHLRLTDDDKKVHIFHHASFLECHRQSVDSLLPAGLAAETLQTLALLLPSTDRKTREWLSKMPRIDQRATHCSHLKTDLRQIERFRLAR